MQHEEYSVEVNVQCGCFQCLTGAQVTALGQFFFMKLRLLSQKPKRAQGSHTRFLSMHPETHKHKR